MHKKVHPIPHQANFFFVVITLVYSPALERAQTAWISWSSQTNILNLKRLMQLASQQKFNPSIVMLRKVDIL